MSVLTIIPAYNCFHALMFILRDMPSSSTIVIDDGSYDDTFRVAEQLGFRCIRHEENLGVGAALKTGIRYGLENDFDCAVTIDADGQHSPHKVNDFSELLSQYDFIIGNRFRDISLVPDCKLSSNFLASLIVRTIFGGNLIDVACGFRAFRLSDKLFDIEENGYGFLHRHLMKILDEKVPVGVVDIDALYDYGQPICTRRSEIKGFVQAALLFVKKGGHLFKFLSELLIELDKDCDLKFNLQNIEFYGIFVAELESYVFQTPKKSVYDFFQVG
jgi:glycosyltransferase involved in cell wall biosynthesis